MSIQVDTPIILSPTMDLTQGDSTYNLQDGENLFAFADRIARYFGNPRAANIQSMALCAFYGILATEIWVCLREGHKLSREALDLFRYPGNVDYPRVIMPADYFKSLLS